MLTEEQLHARRSGVGGSDMAAIMGIDPWRQPIDVFYDKRPDLAQLHGYEPRDCPEFQALRGTLFEEPVAKLYEHKTGERLRRSNVQHEHPQYPWLRANIDRKIEGVRRGVEIKTVTHRLAHLWGDDGTDEVAEYYLPQPHQYMLVLNYPSWRVGAMIGMADLRVYDIERDPEMDELIVDTAHDFWFSYVERGEPPEIDLDHRRAADVLRRVYTKTDGGEILLPPESVHWHEVFQEAAAKAKEYDEIAQGARNHLVWLAGNAERSRVPGVRGAYSRRRVAVKGYKVEPSEYVTFKFSTRS